MSTRKKHYSKKRNEPKQDRDEVDVGTPFVEMFREFQQELDAKHDKHERIVKLGRDCTIRSKRVIFLLHQVSGNEASKGTLLAEAEKRISDEILCLFKSIAVEVFEEDPMKYHKAFTHGLQEFIEALSYLMFLKHKCLITVREVESYLTFKVDKGPSRHFPVCESKDGAQVTATKCQHPEEVEVKKNASDCIKLPLDPQDYVLGIADLTGELMRLCINCVGCGDKDLPFHLLPFLRAVYCGFLSLRPTVKEVGRKISTLKNSLLKVEKVCYTLKIRGSEVPEHVLVYVIATKTTDNNLDAVEDEQF